MVLAATTGDTATAFLELGALVLALAVLARVAGRLGLPAIPLYLVAGLALGEGGLVDLGVSEEFVSLGAEIGVLLLLVTLGLEYSSDELRAGLRTGVRPGLVDAALNFAPGVGAGLLLGWEPVPALLLGGVTWVTSSGVVAKVLDDFDWLSNRETPAVLNLLVFEDLAMAVYLPIVGALVADKAFGETAVTVAVALLAVTAILALALFAGDHLSRLLHGASDESLLLAVFGLTLLVGGLAEQVQVSAAIGAFLVGLALSGQVQHRAGTLIGPLRDLFAAVFFLFFSFQLDPGRLVDAIGPALLLAVVATAGKVGSAWAACAPLGVGRRGRFRAAAALAARGEFSIVIASLGAATADGDDLTALAAAFVLLTAVASPLLAKVADRPAAAG